MMESGYGSAGGVNAAAPNVIRAPGLKRGKMEEAISDRIKLESVLGLTVSSNAALDCDPNTELVAYPAGCTVVLYNVRKNRQTHVLNSSRKSVTCVAFSSDGRYLATGECGHAPAVRVWDLQDPTASGAVQIAEFPGHTHGVGCVAFSTSSKYLVSVGSQHDMIVNVWDWKSNLKLASNKVSSRVKAVSFSENGNYFVTVGFRHVKFWYLEYSRNAKFKEPVPLMGRSAILGEQKDNEFCDVVCGKGDCADSTFAITRGGLLCEFNSRRLLDKWVELRSPSANCMSIGSGLLFVGCAEGLVRVFAPSTLQYVTTLPRTHFLGVDVSQGVDISHMYSQPANARYPDAIALTYDERNHKLTCIYNDHSLYVWDVRDIKRVGKSHSALYHSACIWGLDILPNESSILTCSSDDTVRMWNLPKHGEAPANIYSNELSKIIYIDPELKFLKDVDLTAPNDKEKSKTYDDKIGVRCVRVSPDGVHIAGGDRSGNVFIHSIEGILLRTLEAHDAEVLCLEYSKGPVKLLASASRDRLIHVFQVDRGYQILQTLDDHSSSITAVRFLNHSGGLQMVSCGADKTILFRQWTNTVDGQWQFARGQNVSGRTTLYDMEVDAGGRHVLAACQDRNVRVYSAGNGRHTKTFRGTTAEDGTLIKVALDSSGIYLATSSTDKILSVYDYYSGECMATMYGHSEIVTGLRFSSSCEHLISASGDGCVFVWRVPHDMVVTMRARLAQQAIRAGKKVAVNNGLTALDSETDSHLGSPPREIAFNDKTGNTAPDYTFRIGKLPSWAKKSLGDEVGANEVATPYAPARGKWAKRINAGDRRVDSDGSKDSSIDSGTDTRYFEKRRDQIAKQRPRSLNLSQIPRVEALFRQLDRSIANTYDILAISPRSDKVTINTTQIRTADGRSRHHTDDSSLGSFKYEDQESTEHDGDIEDISDGERTSSSERGVRPTYYPGNTNDTGDEFMVNAMDVEELRKSQRKSTKWNKRTAETSLSATPQHSDDDEVSTPSGDNTERQLLGSNESIDRIGRREKYLKSAFDSLSGAELDNGHDRQPCTPVKQSTLSAQHLNRPVDLEAKKRREELNRRIQETRRQLESVGFKSNLKSSQSTTDLSYTPEKDRQRNRPVSIATPPARQYGLEEENLTSINYYDSLNYQHNKNPYDIPANVNYKCDYKPYVPLHENITNHKSSATPKAYQKPYLKDYKNNSEVSNKVANSKVFNRLYPNAFEKPKRNMNLNLNEDAKPKNSRSIFKFYKSCPVSPVSEECKWADKVADNDKRNSVGYLTPRDSMEAIKKDTKKIIAEITQKYGMKEYEPLDMYPTKDHGDGNFSSDSLEDCSLSNDVSCRNKRLTKKLCKKHKSIPRSVSNYEISDGPTYLRRDCEKSSTLPRNMPSNIDEQGNYTQMNRCQSVLTKRCVNISNESIISDNSNSSANDIFMKYGDGGFQPTKYFINDSSENLYLEKHRHSSASFFLNQKKVKSGSQDSILTDDSYDQSRTNYNSMESILSDDSEYTKSAPLEMLFEALKPKSKNINVPRTSKSCYDFDNTSKSYGSSPNYPSQFSNYMYKYNNYVEEPKNVPIVTPSKKVYGFDVPPDTTMTRSKSLYDSSSKAKNKNIAYYFDGDQIVEYNKEHNATKNIDTTIKVDPPDPEPMEVDDVKAMVKSKSCSFEVVLEPASKPNPVKNLMEKRNSQVQKNLQKFEEQINKTTAAKSNKKPNKNIERNVQKNVSSKIAMEFVPHKPPKPIKRTSSVKLNNKLKDKSIASISSLYKAKLDGLQKKSFLTKKYEDNNSNALDNSEKTFEVYVQEKDINENKSEFQMDSLEVEKNDRNKNISLDSLDMLDFAKDSLDYVSDNNKLNLDINDKSDDNVAKYKCIERKLEIINKLVEMEERKIMQEKLFKEIRMRPLQANLDDGKGVVKVLSEKFDKLATVDTKYLSVTLEEIEGEKSKEIKRRSLPDILDSDHVTEPVLNNATPSDIKPKILKTRVYNEMIIPKTDVHLDSENYESSTSSSCANSPKHLPFYGFNRPNSLLKKSVLRMPIPRLCMEGKTRPIIVGSVGVLAIPRKLPVPLMPEKFFVKTANRSQLSPFDNADETGGMRRAISLSDLAAKPVPAPRTPQGQKPTQSPSTSKSPSGFVRPAPRYSTKNNMTRSSSVGVLNQSDSESDPQPSRSGQIRPQGLMRPTISSMNKANSNTARRRGLTNAYSAVSLTTAAQEESSSEAEDRPLTNKPAIPPRPRAISVDHSAQRRMAPRSGSERDLSAKAREVTARLTQNTRGRTTEQKDITTDPQMSSTQLCAALTDQLTKTASNVVKLYRTLQDPNNTESNDNAALISGLEAAIRETQKVLRGAVSSDSTLVGEDKEVDDTRQKLEELVAKESNAGNSAISLIEQYSDILLNMMQTKMVSQFAQPHSLPPNAGRNDPPS